MDRDEILDIFGKNERMNFVQRAMAPGVFPVKHYEDTEKISTHKMRAEVDESGDWFVFPSIVQNKEGKFHEFAEDDVRGAMDYALRNGEAIRMGKDKDKAIALSKEYKKIWNKGLGD